MKFDEIEHFFSQERMNRYLIACNNDKRKAVTLYRYNLRLSQEVFTIISCFEVALRNCIDHHLSASLGNEWLKDSIMQNGIFTNPILRKTNTIISNAYNRLNHSNTYSHSKLLAEMEFGIWKYMFSPIQYRVTGRTLLRIFPNKPRSSVQMQYNQSYIFNELDKVNTLRNRIAHHEPICFDLHTPCIDTTYITNEHQKIKMLFKWMGVDCESMLFGIDHVQSICDKINALNN